MNTSYKTLSLVAEIFCLAKQHNLEFRIERKITCGEHPTVDINIFEGERLVGVTVTFEFDSPDSVNEDFQSLKAELEHRFGPPVEV